MMHWAEDIAVRSLRTGLAGVLALGALGGCASVSPQHVNTDRMDYGQVVADSWKRQTLLNVVRLRYADAPVFLDVSSIINSYTVGGEASAQATVPSRIDPNVLEFGATGRWSNTPTVTHSAFVQAHALMLELLANHAAEDTLETALTTLQTRLQQQFEKEEHAMQAANFGPLEAHKKDHDQALQRLSVHLAQWQAQHDNQALLSYLEGPFSDWFVRHVNSRDFITAQRLSLGV